MARAPRATIEAKAAAADAVSAEAPRWRVMEKSFVGHAMMEEGTETPFDPVNPDNGVVTVVGENLSPLNESAQAIIDAQAEPHPDKTAGAKPKSARAKADTAASGVTDGTNETFA
jgi:hypothetical protein